ncbi:hypothetical protein TNCV_1803521 [Trichonephila clavipes]|uniref:Uncharacterized protein n=1 Tax=Trichonephila clavipes TaxID=2585209 RepID=A0A8X6SHL5_TRICX|nr:hypothetical protein TNCV_1803521 [Trichonephila clavipes]
MLVLSKPHNIRLNAAQKSSSVNVWEVPCEFIWSTYILLPRLDSGKYLVFLQEVLPEQSTNFPAPVRCRMGFQQDGALSHYGRWYLTI